MNYIGQEIQDFSVKAYQQGELKDCLLYTSDAADER